MIPHLIARNITACLKAAAKFPAKLNILTKIVNCHDVYKSL